MANVVVISDQVYAQDIIARELLRDGYRVVCLDPNDAREDGVIRHCPDVILVDGDLDPAGLHGDALSACAGIPILVYGLKQDGAIGKLKMSVAHAIGDQCYWPETREESWTDELSPALKVSGRAAWDTR